MFKEQNTEKCVDTLESKTNGLLTELILVSYPNNESILS